MQQDQPTERLIIELPVEAVIIEDNKLPSLFQEEVIATTATQNTESKLETAMVLKKETKQVPKGSFRHIAQSFFYALQWKQLKRQLTKDALQQMVKRHKYKAAGLLVVGGLYSAIGAMNTGTTTAASLAPSLDLEAIPAHLVETPQEEVFIVVSVAEKENYIKRFGAVAQAEMKKYGIPASVLLGLAILHSNYGTSPLAQTGHNHFHISCDENHLAEGIKDRTVENGTCYVHYQNAWTSFRANSMRLNVAPYADLKQTARNDYELWAEGLQALGVKEATTLLEIIQTHELYTLDQV